MVSALFVSLPVRRLRIRRRRRPKPPHTRFSKKPAISPTITYFSIAENRPFRKRIRGFFRLAGAGFVRHRRLGSDRRFRRERKALDRLPRNRYTGADGQAVGAYCPRDSIRLRFVGFIPCFYIFRTDGNQAESRLSPWLCRNTDYHRKGYRYACQTHSKPPPQAPSPRVGLPAGADPAAGRGCRRMALPH